MFNLKAKAKKALAERKKLKAIEKEAYAEEKAKATAAKQAEKIKLAKEKGRDKASGQLRKKRIAKVVKGATALKKRMEQLPDIEYNLGYKEKPSPRKKSNKKKSKTTRR